MAQAVDRRKAEKKDELVDKLVYINRVAKTVKGGRNMSFAAVVVVGDQKAASATVPAKRPRFRTLLSRLPMKLRKIWYAFRCVKAEPFTMT